MTCYALSAALRYFDARLSLIQTRCNFVGSTISQHLGVALPVHRDNIGRRHIAIRNAGGAGRPRIIHSRKGHHGGRMVYCKVPTKKEEVHTCTWRPCEKGFMVRDP